MFTYLTQTSLCLFLPVKTQIDYIHIQTSIPLSRSLPLQYTHVYVYIYIYIYIYIKKKKDIDISCILHTLMCNTHYITSKIPYVCNFGRYDDI